jgi:hypothetical protein
MRLPELRADVSGSGAPLLLVHGIGGTRRIRTGRVSSC